jgi:hypothetical protein
MPDGYCVNFLGVPMTRKQKAIKLYNEFEYGINGQDVSHNKMFSWLARVVIFLLIKELE